MAKKLDEQRITELFVEGDFLLKAEKYPQAISKFSEVIKLADKTYPYLSGAYTNLAKATFEQDPLDVNKATQAMEYIKNALKIKPTNQAPKSLAIPILVFLRDFSAAIDYFMELTIDEVIRHNISYFDTMQTLAMKGESCIVSALPSIERLYAKYKVPPIGNILAYTYQYSNETQKAYDLYSSMLREFAGDPVVYISTCLNASLLCSGPLKNPNEAKKIVIKGLEMFRKQNKSFQSKNERFNRLLISNLGMVSLGLNQYKETVDLIEPLTKIEPRNTDLHNLSYAYYRLGNYESALKYCKQALYTSTDELTLFVKAEILFAERKYTAALKDYKMALAFIDQGQAIFEFIDGDQIPVFSFTFDQDEGKIRILVGIINCYIALNEHLNAKAYAQIATKEFPYNDELTKLNTQIDAFSIKKIKEDELLCKIKFLEKELCNLKEGHQREINEVREWALRLLHIQSRCVRENEIILDSEEDWRAILKQMHEIALAMRDNDSSMDLDFNVIKNDFKHQYPKLSESGLEFLSTGEFLYQTHQENDIDFAPIMVEFSKVIETELNLFLRKKKLIKKNQSLTLGQIKHNFHKIEFQEDPNLFESLSKLIVYRNGSAHTGSSTRVKVKSVRDMILNDGWLERILN
ncbi:tetratricopeptide repeat protein [Cytobacillus firmus]|uniref:tetratricopeptide repeat protein n=1 Tax=Cytobacillus firmus TaxID=1399 RepID=UPI003001BE1E